MQKNTKMKKKKNDIVKIVSEINDRIYNNEKVTPEEVTMHCRLARGFTTTYTKGNKVKRITAFCPTGGLLNICVFDFEDGIGRRTSHASVVADEILQHWLTALIMIARAEAVEKETVERGYS